MADKNTIELPSELKGKKFRIRKLTPRECFRLMGVDDNDIDKLQASGVSNSGQYKLAGNSIVVDVLFHLFRKMFVEKDMDITKEGQQLSLF
jgi:DNA (cytosine-5)-methyltransferase 1